MQYIIGLSMAFGTEFTVSDQAFDLISIGGGSGGLACAQRAAEYGARVAVIEPHRLGGTCVNVGCVPKKGMWNAAAVGLSLADAADYGFDVTLGDNDWPLLKLKRDAYVLKLNGIYERNLAAKGVTYVRGAGRFVDKGTVEVNGERLSSRHIVIATGGRPRVPALPGAEHGITSDGFFSLEKRPKRVAIVGSGYVACELAGAFHELGAEVEIFIRKDHLLMSFDAMLGKSLMREMQDQGITVHRHVVPAAVREEKGMKTFTAADGREFKDFVCLLWAVGRSPNVTGLDLGKAGVSLDDCNYIVTDGFQNTAVPGIYAIGD